MTLPAKAEIGNMSQRHPLTDDPFFVSQAFEDANGAITGMFRCQNAARWVEGKYDRETELWTWTTVDGVPVAADDPKAQGRPV